MWMNPTLIFGYKLEKVDRTVLLSGKIIGCFKDSHLTEQKLEQHRKKLSQFFHTPTIQGAHSLKRRNENYITNLNGNVTEVNELLAKAIY